MNDIYNNKLTYEEWLQYVGILLKISTEDGFERRDFWCTMPKRERDTPFKYNNVITRDRFVEIWSCMCFTKNNPPNCIDKYLEVREFIAEWNTNMDVEFKSSDTTCLDESMSKWVNQYTCPGFILCPRKPWPLGNKYYSIGCCKSKVMFRIELVEGKNEPRQRGEKQYNEHGKTIGLLLRLTKPLRYTGTIVI